MSVDPEDSDSDQVYQRRSLFIARVNDTITQIIPDELQYLTRYVLFKTYLEEAFNMPDKLISLLAGFLRQNEGKLSKRARSKEFDMLKDDEVDEIQTRYGEIFTD